MSGRLILVVGPGGAGKDTLLAHARARLVDDPRFVFPQRYITRPGDAGGEDHLAVSPAEFARLRESGALALDWQAHSLSYGLPSSLSDDLAAGRHVVVNVSRTVVATARCRFPGLRVLLVDAANDILAIRLAARGRESAADIRERLERNPAVKLVGPDVVAVANDGELEPAVDRFVAALKLP